MRTAIGAKEIAACLGFDSPEHALRVVLEDGGPVVVRGEGRGARYYADPDALAAWWRARLTKLHEPKGTRTKRRQPKRTRRRRR